MYLEKDGVFEREEDGFYSYGVKVVVVRDDSFKVIYRFVCPYPYPTYDEAEKEMHKAVDAANRLDKK